MPLEQSAGGEGASTGVAGVHLAASVLVEMCKHAARL
jgi:hypothetical protein